MGSDSIGRMDFGGSRNRKVPLQNTLQQCLDADDVLLAGASVGDLGPWGTEPNIWSVDVHSQKNDTFGGGGYFSKGILWMCDGHLYFTTILSGFEGMKHRVLASNPH